MIVFGNEYRISEDIIDEFNDISEKPLNGNLVEAFIIAYGEGVFLPLPLEEQVILIENLITEQTKNLVIWRLICR